MSVTAAACFWDANREAERAENLADFAATNLTDAKLNVQLAELAYASAQAVALTRREEAEALRANIARQ